MSRTHDVKSWPEQFKALCEGRPFDVRNNDRRYAVGDVVVFNEFDDRKGTRTGRKLRKKITHTLEGVPGGIPPLSGIVYNHVVLGLADE